MHAAGHRPMPEADVRALLQPRHTALDETRSLYRALCSEGFLHELRDQDAVGETITVRFACFRPTANAFDCRGGSSSCLAADGYSDYLAQREPRHWPSCEGCLRRMIGASQIKTSLVCSPSVCQRRAMANYTISADLPA